MCLLNSALLLAGFILSIVDAQTRTYTISNNYTGSTFFEGWDFVQGVDNTSWGNVLFQSGSDAKAQNLTYINGANNAIIKVDNSTVGTSPTYGRASIKMSTQAAVNQGSLILFQATHMPYGCSVWPGFWTLGGDDSNWPQYGEIDIVENVNLATYNQYSLHTSQGCYHPPSATGNETGWIVQADCWNSTNFNAGCIVVENKQNNYGQGFAQNGGGAYAVLWNDEGFRFWFFPRSAIPSDFSSASPKPAGWGSPGAFYPTSNCNSTRFFGPQSIFLEIDICGLYAGEPKVYNAGGLCQGLCTSLVQNPRNYDQAYFEIEFLRVFVENGNNGSVTAPLPGPTGTSASILHSPTLPVDSGKNSGSRTRMISTRSIVVLYVLMTLLLHVL